MALVFGSAAKPQQLPDLYGVLLTPIDNEEKYTSETLGDGLAQEHSSRHMARIAHLYFARTAKLSVPDLEDNIPKLLVKLFGDLPCDGTTWGWMGKSFATSPGPNSWWDEVRKDLVGTMDPNSKRWTRDQVANFRVVQLMHPCEKANLLDVLVFKQVGQVMYLYPVSDLSAACEAAIAQVARGDTSSGPVPELVQMLRPSAQARSQHVTVDLAQYVVLRFANWFTGAKRGGGSSDGTPPTHLSQCVIHDLFAPQPCMEILLAWTARLLPFDQQPSAAGLFYRACLASLWLSRGLKPVAELPTLRLIVALHVVFTYLASDPALRVPAMSAAEATLRFDKLHRGISPTLLALRPHWHAMLSNAVARMPCFGSPQLSHVVDLWSLFLQPWRAASRLNEPGKRFASPMRMFAAAASPIRPPAAGTPAVAPLAAALAAAVAPAQQQSLVADAEWAWFIVQHYYLYADVLNQVLARVHVEPNVGMETLESVARAFSHVYSDVVVSVLRGCDLALKGETDLQMSAVQTHLPTSCASNPACVASLKLLHEQRSVVLQALERQRNELGGKLVTLFAQRDDAQNVMQQLHWARKENKHVFAPASAGDKAVVEGMERLRAVFFLPPVEDERAKADFARRFKESASPAVELITGVPEWMRSRAAFQYQRLSFAGLRQLETGELGGNALLASQYMGNQLTNPPPARTYESPLLMTAALALSRAVNQAALGDETKGVNLRPVADARAWLAVFVVVGLLDGLTGTRVAWRLAPLAALVVGTAQFRGPAAWAWVAVVAGAVLAWRL